jgi:hypothetical protein
MLLKLHSLVELGYCGITSYSLDALCVRQFFKVTNVVTGNILGDIGIDVTLIRLIIVWRTSYQAPRGSERIT